MFAGVDTSLIVNMSGAGDLCIVMDKSITADTSTAGDSSAVEYSSVVVDLSLL